MNEAVRPVPEDVPIYGGNVNKAVLERVPKSARRVLDVGCGTGTFGEVLKRSFGCTVVGITHAEAEAREARGVLDEVVVCDLEQADFSALGPFDCIICSHVLEHLRRPRDVLARLAERLAPDGTVVVALPNVLHWKQRLEFLRGRFRYTHGGLMDSTHVVFFDWDTARELVTQAGLRVDESMADGGFPGSRFLGKLGKMLDRSGLRRFPGSFGAQFVIVARR